MRIALISPNPANLREMASVLSAHHVIPVEGGKSRMRGVAEEQAPDAMLVEGMCCDPSELAQVEYISAHYPDTAVVLLCATHTPEFLMHSMRAGVREVLPSPAPTDMLLATVGRIESKRRGGKSAQRGKVLAFISCKGGSGATFLAANLGYQLAENHSVLLIDLNLQFGDALSLLHDGRPTATIADVAQGIERLDASLLSASSVSITPSYSVLAAPEDPAQSLVVKPEHIEAIVALAATHYDFVLLDMARSIDPVAVPALDKAERIFAVTQLTLPGIRNARQVFSAFASLGYPQSKTELIVNRYDKANTIALDDVRRSLGPVTVRTVPNSYRDVNTSIDHGTALVKTARSSAVARTIAEMAASFRAVPEANRSLLNRLLKRA